MTRLHRHHSPITGHRFSIGAWNGRELCGVAIVGRPVARKTCQRTVLEVTRCVTDGTKNACSFLYSAAARAGRELGYERIQTFILAEESGVSLIAAGWELIDAVCGGGDWHRANGDFRRQDQPQGMKKRYGKQMNPAIERALFEKPRMREADLFTIERISP